MHLNLQRIASKNYFCLQVVLKENTLIEELRVLLISLLESADFAYNEKLLEFRSPYIGNKVGLAYEPRFCW